MVTINMFLHYCDIHEALLIGVHCTDTSVILIIGPIIRGLNRQFWGIFGQNIGF